MGLFDSSTITVIIDMRAEIGPRGSSGSMNTGIFSVSLLKEDVGRLFIGVCVNVFFPGAV